MNWQMILKVRRVPVSDDDWRSITYQIVTFIMNFEGRNPKVDIGNLADMIIALLHLGTKTPDTRTNLLQSIRSLFKDGLFDAHKPPWSLRKDIRTVIRLHENSAMSWPDSKYNIFDNRTHSKHGTLDAKGNKRVYDYVTLDRKGLVGEFSKARKMQAEWIEKGYSELMYANKKHSSRELDPECCRQAKLTWLRTRRPKIPKRKPPSKHPIMDQDCHEFLKSIVEVIKNERTSHGDRMVLGDWWYCDALMPFMQRANSPYWRND